MGALVLLTYGSLCESYFSFWKFLQIYLISGIVGNITGSYIYTDTVYAGSA